MTDGRSQREQMLAGDLYLPSDPELQRENRRALETTEQYNTTSVTERHERERILKKLFADVGEGVEIRAPLHCDYGIHTRIGARVFANFNLVLLDAAPITIGDDAQIGPNVQLLTATHPLDPQERRSKLESARPIKIGNNVWLGGGVIVGPGVTIGDNTVVGAGSVVLEDLPANVLAVGNPARVVRTIA